MRFKVQSASISIAILGLDHQILESRRREAVGAALDVLAELSDVEASRFLSNLMNLDQEGRCLPHATALAAVLG